MRRYAAHRWRADPTNLLIISPTGGGKTYLACAIGIAACQHEHGIAHQQLLNALSDTDLSIIDDFLTVGVDPAAANDLFAQEQTRADKQHWE